MATLKARLDACATSARLSTADLAEWFSMAYATVRSYREGVEPYASRWPQIEERLLWLEHAVKTSPKLPIPIDVRASQRRAYMRKIRKPYESKARQRGRPF